MPTPLLCIDQIGTRAGLTMVDETNPLPFNRTSEYPLATSGVTNSSGNVANSAAVASLAAVAGKLNYVTGFEVTSSGSTTGAVVLVTLVGVVGGTMTFVYTTAAGALVGNAPLIVEFIKAVPASALNTAITVNLPALGLGNTNAAVVVHGYQ